jgi:hypothetical protein
MKRVKRINITSPSGKTLIPEDNSIKIIEDCCIYITAYPASEKPDEIINIKLNVAAGLRDF